MTDRRPPGTIAPDDPQRLCRMENFHDGPRALLERPDLVAVLEELPGETPRLFKEKINFKLPGGQGFAPHQDAPAFASFGQTYHVTLMLAVDATTPENGCLELAEGQAGRAFYVTWNRASEGNRRADYFTRKRRAFPPECERDPDAPPDPERGVFNLGNPIR